jgi:hypothetical protein
MAPAEAKDFVRRGREAYEHGALVIDEKLADHAFIAEDHRLHELQHLVHRVAVERH